MRIANLMVFSAAVFAGISEPPAAVVLARDGSAREILGSGGAFVPASRIAGGVLSASNSGRLLVLKLTTAIRAGDFEHAAPEGRAVIGFDPSGTTAFVYFPAVGRLARVTGDTFDWLPPVAAPLDGEVLALSAARSLTLYVRRDGRLHAVIVRSEDGAIESDLPLDIEAHAAAAMPQGLAYAVASRVVIDGVPVEIESPALTIAPMNADWLHVRTAAAELTVRVNDRAVFHLPEVLE